MRVIFPLLLSLMLSACATHYGSVKLVSLPEGAEVINDSDGSVLGTTPTTAWWQDGSQERKWIILRIRKSGYYEKVSSFWLSMRHKSLEDARNNPQLIEVVMQKKGE